jgi:hypothetical protein
VYAGECARSVDGCKFLPNPLRQSKFSLSDTHTHSFGMLYPQVLTVMAWWRLRRRALRPEGAGAGEAGEVAGLKMLSRRLLRAAAAVGEGGC